MLWRKRTRNWKAQRPSRLEDAFYLCKEHARERHNLSVDRIAELMGIKPGLLYKWMEEVNRIASFEHVCGIHFASEYLSAQAGRLVIDLPHGNATDQLDLTELQAVCTEAVATLIRCYREEASQEDTETQLLLAIKGLSWHRENVHRQQAPELKLAPGKERSNA